jgi:tryptophanase
VQALSEDIPDHQYPQKAFLAALYEQSGILASENMVTPCQVDMGMKIIRFALPLRQYSANDMAYVAKEVGALWRNRKQIKGLTQTSAPNCASGHFLAQFEYARPST